MAIHTSAMTAANTDHRLLDSSPTTLSRDETPNRRALVTEATDREPSAERIADVSFDEETDRLVVTFRSAKTGETVYQIPAEDYLRFLARFNRVVGAMLDERV